MNKKIFIIIPAYNEENNIYNVLKSLEKYNNIIVVDDASTDNTYNIVKDFNVTIIKHSKNLGYDQALNSGFKKASFFGADYMITFDGDGQHLSHSIDSIIKKLLMNYDLVIGKRQKKQRFMEKIFSLTTSYAYNIDDPLSGLKAYNSKIYNKLGFFDNYNSIGTQLMFYAIKKQFKYCEVDIVTKTRKDKSRFGNFILSNYKIFRSMLINYFFYKS